MATMGGSDQPKTIAKQVVQSITTGVTPQAMVKNSLKMPTTGRKLVAGRTPSGRQRTR